MTIVRWFQNHAAIVFGTLLGCYVGCAGAQAISAAPASAPAASQIPSTEEERAKIRKHHLKRLDERLNLEPKILREHCRYESDISTAPPAKRVVLTFDDGPEPGQTELILDTLKKYDIRAAFFMIGTKMELHPDLVSKVQTAGHQVIGNHSWSHPNFHDISPVEQIEEVVKAEDAIKGSPGSKLFRYPYGNASCETNDYLHAHGYRIVGWHVDSCDWAYDKDSEVDVKEALSCEVLPQYRKDFVGHVVSAVRAHNGGIVLMHEIHPNTLKKLDEIIASILADGFVFGAIDDLDFQSSLR